MHATWTRARSPGLDLKARSPQAKARRKARPALQDKGGQAPNAVPPTPRPPTVPNGWDYEAPQTLLEQSEDELTGEDLLTWVKAQEKAKQEADEAFPGLQASWPRACTPSSAS